jgi:hypothetical protein
MLINILKLIACHLIVDYVLQGDYLAKTKGMCLYNLWVHCVLYCIPFVVIFGYSWHIVILFSTHFIIDLLKAKYNKIGYHMDQLLHYLCLLIYLV